MITLSKETCQNILNIALKQGLDFAEIYAEKSTVNSLSLENNHLEKIRSGIDLGTGFRVIHKKITYYGYVNSFEEKEIGKLAKDICQTVKKQTAKKNITLTNVQPAFHAVYQNLPEKNLLADNVTLLTRANQAARKFDPRITQVSVGYADITKELSIANSLGQYATEKRIRTRFVTQVIAQKGALIETGFEAIAAAKGLEFFTEQPPETVAEKAARRAITCLEAELAPAGKFPVVLAGEAGGTMVHEACGHALEADFIHKKTSIFSNKLNKKVVSELITVIDDGTMPGMYGSSGVDDEANPTKKNILIENGILKGFMNDRTNADFLKQAYSGNGRRESYRHTPIPRMTNTYIAAGTSNYQDILSSVKKGILVKKMGGGQVDITNGNFVFDVSEGYLIENGKQSTPIRGATIIGNGIEVLSRVQAVGNDLHFIPGTCGKGQHAPVSDGQPTLYIPELVIGGHQ